MTYVPRTAEQIMVWLDKEVLRNSQSWGNHCFSLCRQSWGIPGGPVSAIDAWDNWIPQDKKNTNRFTAPVGAIHYWRGGRWGHSAVQARRQSIIYSNDIIQYGKVDKVYIGKIETQWNYTYLGWSSRLGAPWKTYQYDLRVPLTATQLQPPPVAQPIPVFGGGGTVPNGHVISSGYAQQDLADFLYPTTLISKR